MDDFTDRDGRYCREFRSLIEDLAGSTFFNFWRRRLAPYRTIAEGDTLVKYGHDIGRAVQSIPKGHHVHVHNAKTKRW